MKSWYEWIEFQRNMKILKFLIPLTAFLLGVFDASAAPLQPVTEAQSLTKALRDEGVDSLAAAAREEGSSVRGAILFAQKKLNCTACHAQGAGDLLGPDLTHTGKDVDDTHFVESILMPSKVIKKGFESTKILTRDGRLVIGRIIEENERHIVLRNAADPERRIRLAMNDIDQRSPNSVSTMPDDLANQLEDRQEFLDLVKYLMDIAATGSNTAAVTYSSDAGRVDERIRGMALLDDFGCRNCHATTLRNRFPQKRAPDLTSVASRIDPHYIRRFIADPHQVKPGTTMPGLMAHLDDETRQQAAEAITQYLVSLRPTPFERQSSDATLESRGAELFHSVGCVACHSPRDEAGRETLPDSVPLGLLNEKYSIESLVTFLKDPHSTRPSGRMPNLSLTHWEATDIANYLLAGQVSDSSAPFHEQKSLVATGKRFFKEMRCGHCHSLEVPLQSTMLRALEKGTIDRGCLSSADGDWPRYQFTPMQLAAIRHAIDSLGEELSGEQEIALTMETFRCYSCHSRNQTGGVSDDRDIFFHTANPNLGPQGRIPPRLTNVGAKLKPKWMRQVLVGGRTIRPYLTTRMPQYGADNVAHLVELFQQVDELPETEFGSWNDPKEAKKAGTELVGSSGLNCVACHTFQMKPSQTMPAVDLTEMAERLHKNWFYQYMRSPQLLSPNTVMPSFWPGGQSIRKDILDGDANQQLEAIWTYLLDGRQARMPRGLVIEPIELLATDEAVMLRRSYPGIGKRGIGVGFPGGVNYAFDAEQMRLGMVWKGKFADPGGVWRGQGSGNVRPLGTDLVRFGPGPDLDDLRAPWIVDDTRPPDHQFTGYHLDAHQRPAFTYRFRDIDVEDFTVETSEDTDGRPILRRTLTFSSRERHEGLAFRITATEPIVADGDRTFVVGGKLHIHVDDNHAGMISETAAGDQLVVPLEIPSGKSQLVIRYAW